MNELFSKRQRIINRLLLESPFMKDAGLFYGQTGIMLSFAFLYQKTNEDIYMDYMELILDYMSENLTKALTTDLGKGLAGIGWGMEYLLQKNLIEGNSLEICNDIDNGIMKEDIRRSKNLSLETGLEGLLHYILSHIQGVWNQDRKLPFDDCFLKDVYTTINKINKDEVPFSLNLLFNQYERFYKSGEIPEYSFNFIKWIEQKNNNADISNCTLGLKNGLSGILLITLD